MLNAGFWKRLALALALVKVGAGVFAFASTHLDDRVYPYFFHMVYALPFTAAGLLLVYGGRRDHRAVSLGGFFLMAATSFVNRPLRTYVAARLSGYLFIKGIDAAELDAFMAFFLWSFARDFPHQMISPVWRKRIHAAVVTSLVGGAILFAINLVNYAVSLWRGTDAGPFEELIPMRGRGAYYSVLLTLTVAAFLFLYWRARNLEGTDQRRIRLFLQAFVLSAAPLAEILFALFFPPYNEYKIRHQALDHTIVLIHTGFVLMLPILTPYAVLVHQVLDVKLLARRALQYALARYSAITLAAAPSLALLLYLLEHRHERLDKIFSGYRLPVLVSLTIVGFAALSYRRNLLEAIDRRFFREQYDARRILTQLIDRIRATSGIASLASLVAHEVDLALHLEGASLLVLDPRSGVLIDPRRRSLRLDASSQLARLVSDASDPLTIDLADTHSPLGRLPEDERHWLVDSGFRLIVPILARDGSLLGILGLSEKRSGLPFLKEDRELLRTIAGSAAFMIELDQTRSNTPPVRPGRRPVTVEVEDEDDTVAEPVSLGGELAKECPKCGRLYPSYTVLCNACSTRLEPSHVPYVLPGKFRFEKRIGTGGMGVVYRGSDMALGRPVAVKTLRRVSPEDALRLRREARTAAAVSHPHLAPVYGMETWQGTPMLVLELLEGGTLAHKLLDRGRLTPLETVELGIAMTDALAQLHAADILHRDIKPSNIGYTRDGVPKLMDFGIARLMYDLRREREEAEMDGQLPPGSSVWTHIDGITPQSKPLVGTLSYLSPEALEAKPPDALFDLWSLTIVLYECLLGRKVFSSADPRQTAARIRMGRVPDLLQLAPEYDENLADLFRTALHRSRNRRPASAGELKQKLEAVRGRL
ncbi:MAG TPA: protein kinase [Thermoanaerobaculia bacterium]|nr:protein kinase [Thermoanaerobaculia bacterium]